MGRLTKDIVRLMLDAIDKRVLEVESFQARVTGLSGSKVLVRRTKATEADPEPYRLLKGQTAVVGDPTLCWQVAKTVICAVLAS
jgi:hypothetical protein